MERRVLLAIFLSFLVLYAYQALFVRPAPNPAQTTASGSPTSTGTTSSGTVTGQATPSPSGTAAQSALGQTLAAAPTPGTKSVIGDTEEHDVRLETPHVLAVFTSRGARLKSWRLKAYKDIRGEPLELVANEIGRAHV